MSNLTPVFLILLFLLTLSVLLIRRDYIIVPLIVATCFLPSDIAVTIAGLNFYPIRILALIALIRLLLIPNQFQLKINSIDLLFFANHILGSFVYVIASEDQIGALINRSGYAVDSILLYLVFRSLLHSKESIKIAIKTFCICVIVLLPFIIFEYFAAYNLFSILGRSSISMREGEIRAAATFSHAILFGSFAAALVPLFWAEYRITRKTIYLLAVSCCTFFIIACSSSGPIIALAGVIFFLFFFSWKKYSTQLTWVLLLSALFLHFIREQPLWHLMYIRISIKASSTGYYRYMLVEAAIEEFKNWWLLGYGDAGPDWHRKYWSWVHIDFTDVTNHYLLEGVSGGFFTMLIFIVLCHKVIKSLGVAAIRAKDYKEQWLWWGFAVMMICHCISFLSVAYFGQVTMLLYLTIAVGALACNKIKAVSSSADNLENINLIRKD